MTAIRVCHLYPEHLNIYADRGNIEVLQRRTGWRGIELTVLSCGPGERLPDADLYYLGGGQDRDQLLIAPDLLRHAGSLRAAVDDGAGVLAVCGGYQLLGHGYRGHQGDDMPGIGLVDATTVAGDRRMIGNVVLECELDADDRRTLVGFENHAGRTRLGPDTRPLGRVVHGNGNDGESGFEGVHVGTIIGTYVHGPLLPKNPWLADRLIAQALARQGRTEPLAPLDDELELEAHRVAEAIASR